MWICVRGGGAERSSRKLPKEDTRAKGRPVREKGAGGGPREHGPETHVPSLQTNVCER